ncbi:hypothetical protein Tco_1378762 [Tanacetum coccineum]
MSKASGDIQERELHQLQLMQENAKESCMTSFRLLHSFLQVLSYDELKSMRVSERAFMTLFGQDNETFRSTMSLNLDQLQRQLDKDEFQEDKSMAAFWVLNNQFQKFIDWKHFLDYDSEMTEKLFAEYTGIQVKQFRETLLLHMANVKKFVAERTHHKRQYDRRMKERQMQSRESKVVSSKALDASLVHTNQSEPSYDTYLFDSNTTPDSTNMCHRGGEIDQDAEHDQVKSPLLKAEFLKTNDMVEKEVYNELSNRFLQLEKHCISLEISMQQKEESFQSNKPCKNQESPEFREFFEINDLKAQLQAKTTLICNLKNQIKSVKEASNEPKVKHDIDVLKTINIELESSVAKLLAENEKINKENEHLTQTYKDLYDSIKKTRIQTKDHNDSLIAQVNSKTVENADLKAQIQEKVFANVALKNELRKLKGNSVDTKFAKPSILGKPVLQPPRNQSVVRQPNAFKSERPNFSKPRFASQVDVINVLSKPVTPHYLPKVREYVLAKPHHVIAPGSSRNSQEEPYGSSVMAHNHYLEEARKKTQERNRNSRPSVMHTTSLQNTANGSKPNPRSNNQISRSLPVSKSSCGMSNGVSLVDHSRNSSSFSDSKHFVCSTCHKCVFNANHDNCITKFLKEVDSRAKVQSPKTRNKNKPVEPKSHTQKPGRQIAIGQRFSPKKSSAVHEKPNTPRSCLRWKPTGRIFKIAGLRWIPTGKMFTDNTTKVDSEPPNGSNGDITNPYECDQTLNVSAGTTNSSADRNSQEEPVLPGLKLTPGYISLGLVQNLVFSTPYVPPSKKDYEILFQPLFDEYFNPPPRAVSLDPVAVAAQELLIQSVQLRQLPLIKMYHLLVLHQQIRKFNLKSFFKKAVNLLKKGLLIRGKLWKLLNEEEACLTTKFNNFPKVQVKDLVLLQRFMMTQRTILVAQAAYFLNLLRKFMMSPMMRKTKLRIQNGSSSCRETSWIVVGPEHEGLPWMLDDSYEQVALQAPPSPDYIPGLEEPQSPPLPGFVPEPPLPAAASPTAQSPDYVLESDPEADPEEDDDEDPKEDPVDYPADEGDDDDDEDESSEDDEDDDEVDIEADNEEEEEHPAPADSAVVALPAADQAPSVEETEPFETDESAATPPLHPAYRVTARISIPAPLPTPVWSDAEVVRLLDISTLPSSPLSPWSSPLP